MPKPVSNALFDLIHSLTGHEKRYYKLNSRNLKKSEPIHLELFETIENLSNYDEVLVFEKMKKRVKNLNNLRAHKSLLYQSILRVLREFNTENADIDSDILNQLINIQLLLEKDLLDQAETLLRAVKKTCFDYERYFHFPLVLRLEFRLLYAKGIPKEIEREGSKHLQAFTDSLSVLKDYGDLLFYELNGKKYFDGQNFAEPELAREKYLKSITSSQVFQHDLTKDLLEFRILRFVWENQAYEDMQYNKGGFTNIDWNFLAQRHETFLAEVERNSELPYFQELPQGRYLVFYNNYVRAASNASIERGNKALELFEKAKFKRKKQQLYQFIIGFNTRLRLANAECDKKRFHTALDKYNSYLNKERDNIFPEVLMNTYLQIGTGHLTFGEYEEGEKTFKGILKLHKQYFAQGRLVRIDITKIAYLLLAVIYYRTQEEVKLTRIINNTRAFLRKHSLYEDVSKEVMKYLTKPYNLQEFVKKLHELQQSSEGAAMFSYFEFYLFFQSILDSEAFTTKIRRANGLEIKNTPS